MKIPFFPKKNRGVQGIRFDPTRGLTVRNSTVELYCLKPPHPRRIRIQYNCNTSTMYRSSTVLVLVRV